MSDPQVPVIPPTEPQTGRVKLGGVPRRSPWWGIGAILVSVAAVALAYTALRGEMNAQYAATRDELEAIHSEVRQIRQQMEADASDPGDDDEADPKPVLNTVRFNVAGYPVQGNPKASLVMVEFTDFQCPYCARYHSASFPALKKAYIDSQRMRYVTVDFPLSFHELAFKAAEAAHCGERQGQYWAMHERLFRATPNLQADALVGMAQELGLNLASFKSCLESASTADLVKHGLAEANTLGVEGTPTFIIGRAEGSVVRGRMLVGAYPTQVFDDIIQSHLALK